MFKKNIILITALLILIIAFQVQAAEISLGKDLIVNENTDQEKSLMKNDIDKQFKPYNDFKISKEGSAGYISGPEDSSTKINGRIPPEEKKKGMGVGMGLSLSF
ncbi:hypothetical protein [Desulfovibrio gilichinskyi]|uniref:Uncharacterized protein n=1 Tax=Desulfovibrio gilichinskyi TaxID=1519643 RepID=A0A1X7CE52_9BACT|nr:hypothetical protein [Desulfovibrio gilichinskyi]SME95110.1 hypothetical protein SAMN06295933_0765 [Desulfovibrio gilichinskyi]